MLAVGVFSPFYRQIGKGRGMDCLRGMPFPNLKPPVRERVKTEKGGCPALFGGLFTFARSFLSPRCCFEGSPSLRFMDTARTADVTKNGIPSIGWEWEAWIRPSRRRKAARGTPAGFPFSGYPIIPARYFSGIRSGTRRRSARWGISSPPYPFGMRHTVAHLFRP